MLDVEIKKQLEEVFGPLEATVDLLLSESTHADFESLKQLLEDVASTSPKIKVIQGDKKSLYPQFRVFKNQQPTGIVFGGIPTGHEFTSLILAILNTGGKGKLPDEPIQHRIKSLRGPVKIKTYISLTCENCPDVVQALNQMALIHPDFEHEMIDGAYVQDEINQLNIQGVPSVVVDGRLIHSGRIQFLDLLTKLEESLGTVSVLREPKDLGQYDVVIVGGGPAGVSAAIYSVRKGLKTALLTEKIGGQVNETKGIENLISVVYTEGPQLSGQLYEHLKSYPVQIFENRRVLKVDQSSKDSRHPNFIQLEDGDTLSATQVILAPGAKWRQLGIKGEKEHLGRGVAYCPHCDGPFYKGKKVAVIGGGNSGVEAAIDLAGIVREVVLFEYNDLLKADQVLVDKLKSLPNASIVLSAKTTEVLGDGSKVTGLAYVDLKANEAKKIDLDGIFVQIGLLPSTQFLKGTVELSSFGEIVVDSKQRTSVPGVYAVGDATTTPYKQIVISMGEGAKAALAAFEDRMRQVPA